MSYLEPVAMRQLHLLREKLHEEQKDWSDQQLIEYYFDIGEQMRQELGLMSAPRPGSTRRHPNQRSGAANGTRGAKQRGTHAEKHVDRRHGQRSGEHVVKRTGARVGEQRSASRLRTWDESQRASLRDPREARAYLNAALASDEHELLRIALCEVAKAHGLDALSAATGLDQARLRRMLSARGQLDVHGLCSILRACGLTLCIVPAESAG